MSYIYVPEKDIASYFPVTKKHVLSDVTMDILLHILENRPMSDHWPHFEHSHIVTLGKQLSGSVPCFENTRHFRARVNYMAKSIKPVTFYVKCTFVRLILYQKKFPVKYSN